MTYRKCFTTKHLYLRTSWHYTISRYELLCTRLNFGEGLSLCLEQPVQITIWTGQHTDFPTPTQGHCLCPSVCQHSTQQHRLFISPCRWRCRWRSDASFADIKARWRGSDWTVDEWTPERTFKPTVLNTALASFCHHWFKLWFKPV